MKRNNILKSCLFLTVLLSVFACNPVKLDDPLPLAGDFTDPVYPKNYGRVSMDVRIDKDAVNSGVPTTKAGDLKLQFYYLLETKSSIGFDYDTTKMKLCKEYSKSGDMPIATMFPVGQYLVVARSEPSSTGEYLYGQTVMVVNADGSAMGEIDCQLMAANFEGKEFPNNGGKVSFAAQLVAPSEATNVDVADMLVHIYYVNEDGSLKLAKTAEKYSSLPTVSTYPIGNYIAKIFSKEGEMNEVSEMFYFYGENKFTVQENATANVKLVCAVKNVKVNIGVTTAFSSAFTSWSADLVSKNGNSLFVFKSGGVKTVYVKPQTFDLKISAVDIIDNSIYTKTLSYSDLNSGDCLNVKLDCKETGNANVQLVVNSTIKRIEHDVNFPDDDNELETGGDQPNIKPDPDPKPDPEPEVTVPVIKGEGFNVDIIKVISTSADIEGGKLKVPMKVIVDAQEGISNFIVTITSPDLGEELLNTLFGGDTFDMANPTPQVAAMLDQLGILPTGTPVKNQKTFTFDLTAFMGLLQPNEITHNFKIKVVDNKRQSVEKIVKVKRVN